MSIGIAISVLALVIAFLGLVARYDRLVQKIIYHLYDPKIEITLQHGDEDDTKSQFHISEEEGFHPTYYDEYEFEYHNFPSEEISVETDSEKEGLGKVTQFSCSVHPHGYDEKVANVQLRVITDGFIRLKHEDRRRADPDDHFQVIRTGPNREYIFREGEMSNTEPYWVQPTFVIQMNQVGTFSRFWLKAVMDVSIDSSEFDIPFTNWSLPGNIGEVEFDSIERKWTILGPDHDDVDVGLEWSGDESR